MKIKPPESGTNISGHPLAFSVMRMCCVDPVAALSGTATWPEGYAPDYVENDGGVLRMRMALDGTHNVLMTVDGPSAIISARGQVLSDTALMGVPGLPLRKIVDHVLFTGSPHLVKEAVSLDPAEDGIGTRFHLDGDPIVYVVP